MPSKIKQRGKNSFHFFVPNGYDENKKQKGFETTVKAENITEARKLYDLFKADCLKGKVLPAGTDKMTLTEFYYYWKDNYAATNHELPTISYNDNLFIRIEPALGHKRMDKIKPKDILSFLKQLSADDASYNDERLHNNTIRKYCTLLNTLFEAAIGWELLIKNPMENVTPPKFIKPKKKILEEEALSKLLDKLESESLKHQLWVLLAFSRGLRREEIFGLQWGDINFERKKVTINRAVVYVQGEGIIEKDTKSDNSFRTLSLPPTILRLLTLWRDELRTAVKKRNKRRKVVSIEDPAGPTKWVFQQAKGTVGHPHSFTTFLRRFCENNGIEHASPHLLRHMAGSYLLRGGVDIATISSELGHGNKAFTMKTYIHEIKSEQERSATVMEELLDSLKPKKEETQEKTKGQA
jgi:integrase